MNQICKNRVNDYLLHKQHLLPGSGTYDLIQIARDLCGLHATCPTTPYLSLFARMYHFSKTDLKTEVEINRSLIRTRSIRNTIHLLPVGIYPSAFALARLQSGKRIEQYIKHLGLTRDEFDSLSAKIILVLSGRGLTAGEIKRETGHLKYTSHVINMLCDEGILVRGKINGTWKSNNHSYYRFEDFFKTTRPVCFQEREAVEDFLMRYIRTYGPVKNADIIWWSGLNKTLIGKILNSNGNILNEVEISESPGIYIMLKEDYKAFQLFRTNQENVIHFLPAMDPYIMGYKERHRMIDEAYCDYVFDRFGNASPVIVLSGQIIGIWDVADEKNHIMFFLFRQVRDEIYEKIIKAGVTVGRFYCDAEVDVFEERSVVPVKQLTVGSFMSPLKNALKND